MRQIRKYLLSKTIKLSWIAILIWLILLWQKADSIYAQDSSIPTNAFKGEYFNNSDLTSLVLTREDKSVNFNWYRYAPDKLVHPESFSVRWTGNFNFEEGNYDFNVLSDDGVRLYLDGRLLLDAWKLQNSARFKVQTVVGKGTHQIKVEYFDDNDRAVISVNWSIISPAMVLAAQATPTSTTNPTATPTSVPTLTPTPTPTPTSTTSDIGGTQDGLGGGGDEDGSGNRLSAETGNELPKTGLSDNLLLFTIVFLDLFGLYLFRRFNLGSLNKN